MKMDKILIISDKNSKSLKIKKKINNIVKKKYFGKKNLVIVIGGDGFMLQTLKKNKKKNKLFYGVNSGNYGFLMNKYSGPQIIKNISKAKLIRISPLEMEAKSKNKTKRCLAINEVSILRQSRQAANLYIKI